MLVDVGEATKQYLEVLCMYAKTLENLFMCMLVDQYCILSYATTQYVHGDYFLVEVTFEHIAWRFPPPKKNNL